MPRKNPNRKTKTPPKAVLQNLTNQSENSANKIPETMPKFNEDIKKPGKRSSRNLQKQPKRANEKELSFGPAKKVCSAQSTPTHDTSMESLVTRYEQLQKVISKKYVTVAERLKLDFTLLCAENIEQCERKHSKVAARPKLINTRQLNLTRNAVQQSSYTLFINLVWQFCKKGQFPGDEILSRIVKLLLTVNPDSKYNALLEAIPEQLLCVFDNILRTFPPCWMSLRPSYKKFLTNPIKMSEILPDKTLNAEYTVFEIALMLLEDTVDGSQGSSRRNKARNNSLTYYDDEYQNIQYWEKRANEEQTFSALSKDMRLNRIMHVLHLVAKMLEMDLAMWMLRHPNDPRKYIYSDDDQPLVITLFSLSVYSRSPVLVKRLMTLFALCVQKDLDEHYLRVVERFISLLANIQNLFEIETTVEGIRYPLVGPVTRSFTMDLFKTAEVNIKKDVNTYMRFIKTLRCPFVQYEIIDHFLQRLNPHAGKMSPQKIVENFRKNHWLDCEPDSERSSNQSSSSKLSFVYRQDYLKLLLDALRNYCDFYGIKEFVNAIKPSTEAAKDPPSEKCTPPYYKNINLSKFRRQIGDLVANMDKSVKLRNPKTEISFANIRISHELYLQYRNDIKYVMILHAYIPALQAGHDEDFSEWIDFLDGFTSTN